MSQSFKLKKGFNINLIGTAEKKVAEITQPETFAMKPTDFHGITRPKVIVNEGENVKAGSPLFFDKTNEKVLYTAPVSGEIAAVKRGEKRKLLEIVILADKKVEYQKFKRFSASELIKLSREDITDELCASGLWPAIIQRPYGIVANPEDSPKAIFISGFDSNPLAADLPFLIDGQEVYFQTGIDVLGKLTSGKVHLNIDSNSEMAQIYAHANNVELNKFSGPHPAGNVGIQIHHLDPMNKGEVAWTINPVHVVQIGKLFSEGVYDSSKIIALTGSEVKNPVYVKSYTGAHVTKLLENQIADGEHRIVSGNPLTGEAISEDGYLGFYHNQVTVIPEGKYEEVLGWMLPSLNKLSFHKAIGLLSPFLGSKKQYIADTNTHGEKRNFVVTGSLEKVLPMDILPTHLFKAIIAEDYDEMEALGIYEVIEEDVALCEFIDVSKHELQSLLRHGLELIKNS